MSVSRLPPPRRVSFRVVIGVMRPRAQWQSSTRRGEMQAGREARGGQRNGWYLRERNEEECTALRGRGGTRGRAGEIRQNGRRSHDVGVGRGRGKDADYGVSNNHADCIFCADSFRLSRRLLASRLQPADSCFPFSFVVIAIVLSSSPL